MYWSAEQGLVLDGTGGQERYEGDWWVTLRYVMARNGRIGEYR